MHCIRVVVFVLSCVISASAVAVEKAAPAQPASPGSASSAGGAAAAKAQPRLNYAVYGGGTSVVDALRAALSEDFRSAGVLVTNRFPSATLVLYAMQDVNSNVNKSGVTIAIAYVSNAQTDRFAANLIKKQGGPPPALLIDMLRQDGFLYHLSAAHLDNSSAKEVNAFAGTIVAAFLQKVGAKG